MLRCCAMLLLVSPSLQMVMQPRLLSSRAVPQIRPSLRSDIFMQGATPGAGGGAGEQERSRGRSAVVSKPKPKPISKRKEDVDKEPMWRVLLHNDDVHTWDYVIFAIVSVVKTITRKKAHRITTQVGRSHPFPSSSTPISIRWRCHDRDRDDRHRATLFVSHPLPSITLCRSTLWAPPRSQSHGSSRPSSIASSCRSSGSPLPSRPTPRRERIRRTMASDCWVVARPGCVEGCPFHGTLRSAIGCSRARA